MRLHPREAIVKKAESELREKMIEIVMRSELTEGESLSVVIHVMGDWLSGIAKYMIREERHPGEPNKPGGLE
jgi:hypothetical protein